jgi:hypothetical protein
MEKTTGRDLLSRDGLHQNDLGCWCMAEHIARVVVVSAFSLQRRRLRRLSRENAPYAFGDLAARGMHDQASPAPRPSLGNNHRVFQTTLFFKCDRGDKGDTKGKHSSKGGHRGRQEVTGTSERTTSVSPVTPACLP